MTDTTYTRAELAELSSEWKSHLEDLKGRLLEADDALCGLDNSHLEPDENHPSHVAAIHRYERKVAVAETAISTLEAGGRLDEAFAAMACNHEGETAAAFEAAAKKWAGH